MNADELTYLKTMARTLRLDAMRTIFLGNSWHYGTCFSAAEIVSVLYFKELRLRPEEPYWADRDRFIMSKGHGAGIWYSALAEKGYFSKDVLDTYRKLGSPLQGHPNMRKLPGLDMTSGSLGNGLGIAAGMACAAKTDNKDYRVYALTGDGELEEGSVWEAAMFARQYELDNLTVIIDYNKLQVSGGSNAVMKLDPLDAKWRDFGYHVIVIDGHNIEEIAAAFDTARAEKGRPTCIIANTVKGKGVSFMENKREWHYTKMDQALYDQAYKELTGGQQ